MEEYIYANNNQKTVGVVIILLDKIDFMQKRLQETMDLIKGSIHLKDVTIINIIHIIYKTYKAKINRREKETVL